MFIQIFGTRKTKYFLGIFPYTQKRTTTRFLSDRVDLNMKPFKKELSENEYRFHQILDTRKEEDRNFRTPIHKNNF